MGIRMLPLAATLVAALMLAGCVPSAPVVTPVPESSVAPIFATDEDALAAATEAYRKYLDVSDSVFQNGGHDTDLLSKVITGEYLLVTTEAFQTAAEKGLRSTGHTTFDQVSLQQYDKSSTGPAVVVAYVCEDVSNVGVVDSTGNSVVSTDRPNRTLFEVTFDFEKQLSALLISQRTAWSVNEC